MLFLALRFCFSNKAFIAPGDYEQEILKDKTKTERDNILHDMRENTDFMKASSVNISQFVMIAGPTFIFVLIKRFPLSFKI